MPYRDETLQTLVKPCLKLRKIVTNSKHRIDPKLSPPRCRNIGQKSGVGIMSYSLVDSISRYCAKFRFRILKLIQKTRTFCMKHQAVNNYLNAIYEIYQAGSKEKKSQLLDIAELVTKRTRKQLIRRLNRLKEQEERGLVVKVGRPLIYSREELIPHIRYLWLQMERVSAKRMKEAFKLWLPKYKECPAHLRVELEKMSPTTLSRYLKDIRGREAPKKGLSTTCPARYMKNKVPINTLDSKITRPGYTQTDTVAHCGNRVHRILTGYFKRNREKCSIPKTYA